MPETTTPRRPQSGERDESARSCTGPLTFGQLHDLPVSIDIPTAGRMLRIGRTRAYAMARAGTFPARVIPVGAGYVVPTAEVLRLLGIDTPRPAPHPPATPLTLRIVESCNESS